jgi:hypothetical protein
MRLSGVHDERVRSKIASAFLEARLVPRRRHYFRALSA